MPCFPTNARNRRRQWVVILFSCYLIAVGVFFFGFYCAPANFFSGLTYFFDKEIRLGYLFYI